MIQRWYPDYCYNFMRERDDAEYVLFTDHEADKAKAVADAVAAEQKKTAEMRAELVEVLTQGAHDHAELRDGWLRPVGFHPATSYCVRLCELGVWESEERDHAMWFRPIESEASDE